MGIVVSSTQGKKLPPTKVKPKAYFDENSKKLEIRGNNYLVEVGNNKNIHVIYKDSQSRIKTLDTKVSADSFTSASMEGTEKKDTIWLNFKGAKNLKNLKVKTYGYADFVYIKGAPKHTSTSAELGSSEIYAEEKKFGFWTQERSREQSFNTLVIDDKKYQGNVKVDSSVGTTNVYSSSTGKNSDWKKITFEKNTTKNISYSKTQNKYLVK